MEKPTYQNYGYYDNWPAVDVIVKFYVCQKCEGRVIAYAAKPSGWQPDCSDKHGAGFVRKTTVEHRRDKRLQEGREVLQAYRDYYNPKEKRKSAEENIEELGF